ncbi:hypothetical protein U5801_21545 [Lamprobacter modestohalophilus]|uniref:hypothetical protein n=1 Tax=Lamprobacter modestohalophilus TaxID=1064514 RepID=UPI002ADECFB6|nr:hypothetical protein [Lamprobacter modestohalophilus]MEA1052369.1 hypothetical protein [Lamprobacter modestohalophilus]
MRKNNAIETNPLLSELYRYFESEIENTDALDRRIHAAIERADLSAAQAQDTSVQGTIGKVKAFVRESWSIPGSGDAEDRFFALAAADGRNTRRVVSETARYVIDEKYDEDHPDQYLYSVTVKDTAAHYEGRVPVLVDEQGYAVTLSAIQQGRARTPDTVARLQGVIELHWARQE